MSLFQIASLLASVALLVAACAYALETVQAVQSRSAWKLPAREERALPVQRESRVQQEMGEEPDPEVREWWTGQVFD